MNETEEPRASPEQRVASLEEEVARLRRQLASSTPQELPWWTTIIGSFRDDPAYEEAMRLGRQWRESSRPRPIFTIGNAMIAIVAAAAICALAVEARRLDNGPDGRHYALSAALAVVLFGGAIGMAMRLSPRQYMAQVALASCLLMGATRWARGGVTSPIGFDYLFLGWFTLTILAPLGLRRLLEDPFETAVPRHAWALKSSAVLCAGSMTVLAVFGYLAVCTVLA